MPGKTQITIVGNLGDDPELRFTPSGVPLCVFRVAVAPRFMQDGAWVTGDTTWYRVNAWRSLAENVAETLQRGSRVIVLGYLENRPYEKDDETRYSLEITADAVGPDLLFASARITKSQRSQDSGQESFSDAPDFIDNPDEPGPNSRPNRPAGKSSGAATRTQSQSGQSRSQSRTQTSRR